MGRVVPLVWVLCWFGPADEGDDAGDEGEGGGLGGWRPLEIETAKVTRERKGPTNSYAISFPQGIIWGVIGCAAGFGISLVTERTRGTLVRLRMVNTCVTMEIFELNAV